MRPAEGLVRRPALDGLRGIAVLAVLAYHGDRLSGGFLGVDLFFVLSGFLITALLLVEHRDTGTISLGRFWGRRARRLLPAMFAVVTAAGLYAWRFADPHEMTSIRRDGIAALTYSSNWVQMVVGEDYWARFTAPSPLQHMWSLAIEEQFYLVWPLVTLGVVRLVSRGSTKRAAAAMAVVCAVGVAASVTAGYLIQRSHGAGSDLRLYYGTDTRGGAILMGGLVASLLHLARERSNTEPGTEPDTGPDTAPSWFVTGVLTVAIVHLGWLWATVDGDSSHLWRVLAISALDAAVILAVVGSGVRTPWHVVLEVAPLRWVGLISYGLYLWHWPLFVLLDYQRTNLAGTQLFALRVAATFVAAIGSYFVLEQPVRRRWITGKPLAVAAPLALLLTIALLVQGTVPWSDDREGNTLSRFDHDRELARALTIGPPAPTELRLPAGTPVRLMVVGDSLAKVLAQAAVRLQHGSGSLSALMGGPDVCPYQLHPLDRIDNPKFPASDWVTECTHYLDQWRRNIAQFRPNVVLITYGAPIDDADIKRAGRVGGRCDPEYREMWRNGLEEALRFFRRRDILPVVATIPYRRGSFSRLDPENDCRNADIARVAGSRSDTVVVDLQAWVCPAETCRTRQSGRELRPDGVHFADDTAEIAMLWILRQALGPWEGP